MTAAMSSKAPMRMCSVCASIRTRCGRRTPITAATRWRCCSAISAPAARIRRRRCRDRQVFCASRNDIIAHETTHALLDGLHPRFQEATNPDVLAFHEAFADIVALFQHFTIPEALLHQIRQRAATWSTENLLGQLAVQFGMCERHARCVAQRDRCDRPEHRPMDQAPSPRVRITPRATEPHARGADAGLGGLRGLPDDLSGAQRRSDPPRDQRHRRPAGRRDFASISPSGLPAKRPRSADQVLNMCIRALDYCPPVDVTFGDYLRAIITADRDLVRSTIAAIGSPSFRHFAIAAFSQPTSHISRRTAWSGRRRRFRPIIRRLSAKRSRSSICNGA